MGRQSTQPDLDGRIQGTPRRRPGAESSLAMRLVADGTITESVELADHLGI
jgi:hypothetical protein